MLMKAPVTLILLCLSLSITRAQRLSADARAEPAKAASNQPIKLTFTINTSCQDMSAPDLSAFVVFYEPRKGVETTEVDMDDEKTTTDFTFIIIPKYPGRYIIGPATFHVNGKDVSSNTLRIDVNSDKIPRADSAKIVEEYSLFKGNLSEHVETKSNVHYSGGTSGGYQNTAVEQKFEITPDNSSITVAPGQSFEIVYSIDREGPQDNTFDNVQFSIADSIAGFEMVKQPEKAMQTRRTATQKKENGTITFTLKAAKKGKFTVKPFHASYQDQEAEPPEVEVIVQ